MSRCDVSGISMGTLLSLRREEERLKAEREEALEAAHELIARAARLKKQY